MARRCLDEGDATEADEPLNPVKVHKIIEENLNLLKHGDLFMAGLGEECYGKLLSATEEGSEMTANLSKFLEIVAEAMANAENSGNKKGRKKLYLKGLKLKKDEIEEAIRHHEEKKSDQSVANSDSNSIDKSEDGEGDAVDSEPHNELGKVTESQGDEDDDSRDDGSSSLSHRRSKKKSKKKTKKGKKKPRREKHRRTKDDFDNISVSGASDINEALPKQVSPEYIEAVQNFERDKKKTLTGVSGKIKARFRQLCFASWSKKMLPGIELGPYDVSPGTVRDQWLTMNRNCTTSGRPLTRLIYWYGTPRDNLSDGFSFVQNSHVVSYDYGVQQGYAQLPPSIIKKKAKGKNLSKLEHHHEQGLIEITEELKLDPNERLSWIEIEEDYEFMYSLEQVPVEEIVGVKEEQIEEESQEPVSKKGKKRKKEKKNGHQEEDSKRKKKLRKVHEEDGMVEEDVMGNKRKKKRKKSKAVGDVDERLLKAQDKNYEPTEVKGSAKKKKKKVKQKVKTVVITEEEFTKDEQEAENHKTILSEGEKDSDFQDEPEADGVFEKESSGRDMNTGLSEKKRPVSQRKKVETVEHQEMSAKKRDRDKKKKDEKKRAQEEDERKVKEENEKESVESESNLDPHELQQRYFEECEDIFLPIMSRLDEALSTKDVQVAEQCLDNIHQNVEKLTPPFVKSYGLGMAIKNTRKALKTSVNIGNLCRNLTKEMKRVYLEKNVSMPDNFEPKKAKNDKNGTDERAKPPADTLVKRVKDEPHSPLDKMIEEDASVDSEPSVEGKDRALPVTSLKEEMLTSPMMKEVIPLSVPKKEEKKLLSDEVISKESPNLPLTEQLAQPVTSKAAPQARPARKSFSLKGMFKKPKQTRTVKERAVDQDRVAPVAKKQVVMKESPLWLTVFSSPNNLAQEDGERRLASDFFLDAARCFPADKVNVEAIANSVELAAFEYSKMLATGGTLSFSETYWQLVHDIAGAISGKQGPDTLYHKILDGEFSSAKDVVKLLRMKRKSVKASFEGLNL